MKKIAAEFEKQAEKDFEQLDAMVKYGTTFAGDTLSHNMAYRLEQTGAIRRVDKSNVGDWVVTIEGFNFWFGRVHIWLIKRWYRRQRAIVRSYIVTLFSGMTPQSRETK